MKNISLYITIATIFASVVGSYTILKADVKNTKEDVVKVESTVKEVKNESKEGDDEITVDVKINEKRLNDVEKSLARSQALQEQQQTLNVQQMQLSTQYMELLKKIENKLEKE